MRPFQTRAIALAFLAFVTVPLLAHVAGVRPLHPEAQTQAARPSIEPGSALQSSYYRDWARYLQQNFPFRNAANRANALLDQELFEATNHFVVRGDAGWLYLRRSFTRLCKAPLSPSEAVDIWVELVDGIAASGTEVVVTVVPDKFDVYPEHLGPLAGGAVCAESAARQIEAAFASSGRAWFVPLWDVLVEGKSVEQLYYQKDTHWNDAGAMLGLEAILGDTFSRADITIVGPVKEQPDLARLLGVPDLEQVERRLVRRAGVAITATPVPEAQEGLVYRYDAVSSGAALNPGTTLVIHDSFLKPGGSVHLIESMAQFNEQTVFVSWDYAAEADLDTLIAQSDRVVIEVAQRMFSDRTHEVFGEANTPPTE